MYNLYIYIYIYIYTHYIYIYITIYTCGAEVAEEVGVAVERLGDLRVPPSAVLHVCIYTCV